MFPDHRVVTEDQTKPSAASPNTYMIVWSTMSEGLNTQQPAYRSSSMSATSSGKAFIEVEAIEAYIEEVEKCD